MWVTALCFVFTLPTDSPTLCKLYSNKRLRVLRVCCGFQQSDDVNPVQKASDSAVRPYATRQGQRCQHAEQSARLHACPRLLLLKTVHLPIHRATGVSKNLFRKRSTSIRMHYVPFNVRL